MYLDWSKGSKYLICFDENFSWFDKSKFVLEWMPSSSLNPNGKLNSISHAASAYAASAAVSAAHAPYAEAASRSAAYYINGSALP